MGASTIDTDYLVVGAGALGMAFVDTLVGHSDASVVMIDRRHRPGGHWLDAYPFVQLHQPSRYYGVDSTPLGQDRPDPAPGQDGFVERATAAEICAYYDDVMRNRLLPTGRVTFLPMTTHVGGGVVRRVLTGEEIEVRPRRAVVDATYMASRVPATEPPPFVVGDGVRCVPVGAIASLDEPPAGYVIVGGGKTATDAIGWLLDQGVDADAITWVRPQDSWVLDRSFFQPDRARTFAGTVLQLEAMVECDTVDATYVQMEAAGIVARTDPAIAPTMMRGATISRHELAQLERVGRVVRLGRVLQIDRHEIVLTGGRVPTTPGHLHVHCAAPGLSAGPPFPIYGDGAITLQLVTRLGLTLSGALQGVVEASGRSTEEKNAHCRPTSMPHTPFDYLRCILDGIRTEMTWGDAPDLQQWMAGTRLNLLRGLGTDPAERDEVAALQGRFFAALRPAFEQLDRFAAAASPAERARMLAPTTAG